MPLNHVDIGWEWLRDTLNTIIDEVNEQKPLQSASIAIEETPYGTLLKVIPADKYDTGAAAGNQQGSQQQQPPQQQQPQPVIWHGVTFRPITIVDPVSCAQSQVLVLVQAPGTIQIQ